MMGEPQDPFQKGIIPRALEQVLEACDDLAAQGWEIELKASMLEIHNETLHDLFDGAEGVKQQGMKPGVKQQGMKPGVKQSDYHIKDSDRTVSGLRVIELKSMDQVFNLLRHAVNLRSVAETNMNRESSRGHMVFTLRIGLSKKSTEEKLQGVLNLVDLAGSERVSDSGAIGGTLTESKNINRSLSALCDVFVAIANNNKHIPFRNSKLTYLLEPCLKGNSKWLMFVTVSPDPDFVVQSLSSLRFAAKVNGCEIGVAHRDRGKQTKIKNAQNLDCI